MDMARSEVRKLAEEDYSTGKHLEHEMRSCWGPAESGADHHDVCALKEIDHLNRERYRELL